MVMRVVPITRRPNKLIDEIECPKSKRLITSETESFTGS